LKLIFKGGEFASKLQHRRANLFGSIGLAISLAGPLLFFLFVLYWCFVRPWGCVPC
jgi:hypothetical protein